MDKGSLRGLNIHGVILCPAVKKEGQVAVPVQAKGTLHPRGSRWSALLLPEHAKKGRRPVCGEHGGLWPHVDTGVGCVGEEPALCSQKAWRRVVKGREAQNGKEV